MRKGYGMELLIIILTLVLVGALLVYFSTKLGALGP